MTTASDRSEKPLARLILLVTGRAPRSQRARSNLAEALSTMGLERLQPMEIDLLEKPSETITYSVFATPALLRTNEDGDVSVIYGDLSEPEVLRGFLADLA